MDTKTSKEKETKLNNTKVKTQNGTKKETNEEKAARLAKQNEKAKKSREKNKMLNKTDPMDMTGKSKICKHKNCRRQGKELPYTEFPYDCYKRPPFGIYCNECKNNGAKKKYETEFKNLDPEVETKKCNQCEKMLLLKYFDISRTGGDKGRKNECKTCDAKKDKEKRNFTPQSGGSKSCSECKRDLDVSEFDKDTYSAKTGLQSRCKLCRKKHFIKRCNEDASYFIKNVALKNVKNRCKDKCKIDRNITCKIDSKFISKMYEDQNHLCAVTGKQLTHKMDTVREISDCHIINPLNISIDRIDSSKGYTKSNVRLVGAAINIIMQDLDDFTLFSICSSVCVKVQQEHIDQLCKFMKTEPVFCKEPLEAPENIENYIKKKYSNTKGNAKSRDLDREFTVDDIINQYKKQNGQCRFTGKKLTFGTDKLTDMSIDRIDSKKGYTKHNIQLIGETINKMKSDLPDNKFIDYCIKISEGILHSKKNEYEKISL